jgi:hypothetical protein
MRWTLQKKITKPVTPNIKVPEREIEALVKTKQYQEEHAWHIHEAELRAIKIKEL